jgi:hypothetical protein
MIPKVHVDSNGKPIGCIVDEKFASCWDCEHLQGGGCSFRDFFDDEQVI